MQTTGYLPLLPEITRRIVVTSDPEKIILFGSYARGDYQADSDLGFLVILNQVDSPRAESLRIRRALRGLLVPVDVVIATMQQVEQYREQVGYLYQAALAEGRTVYERSPGG